MKQRKTRKILHGGVIIGFAIAMLLSYAPALTAEQTPQRGGTLKYYYHSRAGKITPLASLSCSVLTWTSPVFSSLVRPDPKKDEVTIENMVPDVAKSWDISSDGKVYTFHLRKGVKFHNGNAFTAEDVKFSLDEYADPKKSVFAGVMKVVDRVEVVDDYTVKVYLKYPYRPFLTLIMPPYCIIKDSDYHAKVNATKDEFLMGTGPFKFKSRVPGKVWTYVRNEDYYLEGLPYVDEVKIYVLSHPAATDAYLGGRLNVMGTAFSNGLFDDAQVEKIKKFKPEGKMRMVPTGIIRGLYFNTSGAKGHEGPWQDSRVRRAIAKVIDYPAAIKAALGSLTFGKPSGVVPGFVPSGFSWDKVQEIYGIDKPMEQRIADAKKLLAEAGYPNGFSIELALRKVKYYVRFAEYLADQLRKINIDVKVNVMAYATYYAKRDAHDYDMTFEGIAVTFFGGASPEEFLCTFLSEGPMNYSVWSNPEYDKLHEQLLHESNPEKRKEISEKLQRIFYEDTPGIIMINAIKGLAWSPEVHVPAFQPAYINAHVIDHVWIEQ